MQTYLLDIVVNLEFTLSFRLNLLRKLLILDILDKLTYDEK